jgi:predicted glycosyltransferase
LRFLHKLLLVFAKILIITLAFEKNAIFFAKKLAKIAEISDHSIDPRFLKKLELRRSSKFELS